MRRRRPWRSIRGTLALAGAALLSLILLLGGTLWWSTREASRFAAWVEWSTEILATHLELQSDVSERIRLASLGILSERSIDETPMAARQSRILDGFQRLDQLLTSERPSSGPDCVSSSEQASLGSLRAAYKEVDELLAQAQSAHRQDNSRVARDVLQEQALPVFQTKFAPKIVAVVERERTEVATAQAAAERSGRSLSRLGMIICAASLLLGAVFAILMTRSVTRRIHRLTVDMKRLATGDLETPVETDGHDELSMIATDLDRMRLDLRDATLRVLQAEKLVTAGKLAGCLSHEINNPLAVVQGGLWCLEQNMREYTATWDAAMTTARFLQGCGGDTEHQLAADLLGSLDQRQAAFSELAPVIQETGDAITRLTDLIANLGKLTLPVDAAEQERVPIADVVKLCAGDHAPAATRVDVPDDLTARVSREDLRTSISHIIKFLGGRDGDSGRLQIIATQSGRPTISIRDADCQISAVERRSLFEPRLFVEQGEARRVRLDLGLPIAHQLLQRNGAQLEIVSEPNIGTTFRIQLAG